VTQVSLLSLVALLIAPLAGMVAAQPAARPVHPRIWRYVGSPDAGGALLHEHPWGAALAAWPDGAAIGVLDGPVLDGGAAWLKVQDPHLGEGWMAADRLVEPSTPVESQDYRSLTIPDYGGVKPLGRYECPAGFPIKGEVGGRSADALRALGPEFPDYAAHVPFVCFRTRVDASAWGTSTKRSSSGLSPRVSGREDHQRE
jgi:hypothetical protein